MAGDEDWSCDANKAITIEFVSRGTQSPQRPIKFHPQFTYPIFGDAQTIFGYQGLHVNLQFASDDLRPHLEVSWEKQYETVGDTAAVDVKQVLEKWLPSVAFEATAKFEEHVRPGSSTSTFKPLGQLVNSYKTGNKSFEVWRGQLTSPDVREMLERMQIFIPFFIEGGTYINLEDPDWSLQRWHVYFLYERRSSSATPATSSYHLLGYATVYAYYLHSSSTSVPSKEPAHDTDFTFPIAPPSMYLHRSRISQFLILPPFQHQGHGSQFYNSLATDFLDTPSCVEITVEDPNEAFDDLRDYCDLARLRTGDHAKVFTSLRIDTDVTISRKSRLPTSSLLPRPTLTALRKSSKIAPRQFERLVEMQLLSRIPRDLLRTVRHGHELLSGTFSAATQSSSKAADTAKDKEYYAWRLLAKHRLYKFNRDKLAQVELAERIKNLEEVTDGVEADYLRLLGGLDDGAIGGPSSVDAAAASNGNAEQDGVPSSSRSSAAKRPFSVEDVVEDMISGTQSPAKRPKA